MRKPLVTVKNFSFATCALLFVCTLTAGYIARFSNHSPSNYIASHARLFRRGEYSGFGFINTVEIPSWNSVRIRPLYSLEDYAMERKKGLGPRASRRWGARMDRERRHNFGNVAGNEDIGGCNSTYKFVESYFDEENDGYHWPPEQELIKSGNLNNHLRNKTGGPYGSYKSLLGEWKVDDGAISIIFDRIQSDPFAPPSNIRVRVAYDINGFPTDLLAPRIRNIATCDYIIRKLSKILRGRDESNALRGVKRKTFEIAPPTQYVLERKSLLLNSKYIEARLFVHLPGFGRRVDGNYAARMFCEELPKIVKECLFYSGLDSQKLYRHVYCIEDQDHLRRSLKDLGLVAFVTNGAILPRATGTVQVPLDSKIAKSFVSPDSLQVTIPLLNRAPITGMGIKSGVTVIVGGGYHGKSTLLEALQVGIYNKVPGDGREFVVTSPNAVKVRAEDGRSVTSIDISTFIGTLPNKKDSTNFTSANASGSTSQAAAIMEAIEMGADVLLLDEDISASNFMFRDNLMDDLVSKDKEPITTFLMLTRGFYEQLGISTILVSGSCGAYMDPATCVIQMDQYTPHDRTEQAKELCLKHGLNLQETCNLILGQKEMVQTRLINSRIISSESFKREQGKIKQHGTSTIDYGKETINIGLIDQLVDKGQVCAIANILFHLEHEFMSSKADWKSRTLRELLETLYSKWHQSREFTDAVNEHNCLDDVNGPKPFPAGDCAMPRIFEVAAVLNRMPALKVSRLVKTPIEPQQNHPL
ncbi:bifunctional ABC transporter [Babesia duncani]|uniref:Bifunctional ABC transporter n=1 Tax=Babesia duncani TaxID=323732 RepID=A0AAD9PKR3_9APIC|nr:bifunctional ABC transporter [Babesia duncani]